MAITLDGSKGLVLPSWTTAGRPNNPEAGQMGLNTTLGYIEWYSATSASWYAIYQGPSYSVEYFMIGGGGGSTGGTSSVNFGAGGAAGTAQSGTFIFQPGAIYTVVVGAGGSGAISGTPGAATASSVSGTGASQSANFGTGPSSTSKIGGSNDNYTGANNPTGGVSSGGGAGAGGNSPGFNGGVGATTTITGASQTLGGGGGGRDGSTLGTGGTGGGGNATNATGGSGTVNTGSGGGGTGSGQLGGSGGSGVVFLSVPTSRYTGMTTGSPTVTTSGNNTILKFTSTGTYTA